MNPAPKIRVALSRLSVAAVCTGLAGCNGFFVSPPQNTMVFTTSTQVFADSTNTSTPIISIPRPYQPIRGYSPTTNQSFGSSPGSAYNVWTTVSNGLATASYSNASLEPGIWDVYYNWYPQTTGCTSPSYTGPTGSTPSGDWNVSSAPPNYYESLNANNPLQVTFNASLNYTAPVFYCNMLAADLAATDSPLVLTTAPSATSTLTTSFNRINPTPPFPPGTSPSSITLVVTDSSGAPAGTSTPTATSFPDSYTAIFPYPSGLGNGMYGTFVQGPPPANAPPGASPQYLGGEGYFFIGSANPNYKAAFGVAVQDLHQIITICLIPPGKPTGRASECTTSNVQESYPVVTSLTGGTLTTGTGTVTVGTTPVAVATYGTQRVSTYTSGNPSISRDQSGTGYALVVNYGSNSVSLVNLISNTVAATIPVGTEPVAVAVDNAGAYAYVANYSGNTISKISLSTYAVVATIAVRPNPTAVSMDSGNNLYVGGNGYIVEYNSSTLAPISTSLFTGVVNSLVVSSAQNKVLSSIVTPPVVGSTHALAQVSTMSIGGTSPPAAQFVNIGDPYVASTVASFLPTPYLLSGGSVVSANYGNNLSISATPSGFVVQDVHTGAVLASDTTSAPIRGIAVDQTFGYAYLTIPDLNTVITFPMPGSN